MNIDRIAFEEEETSMDIRFSIRPSTTAPKSPFGSAIASVRCHATINGSEYWVGEEIPFDVLSPELITSLKKDLVHRVVRAATKEQVDNAPVVWDTSSL